MNITNKHKIIFLLILLCALCVRLPGLGRGIELDEPMTIKLASLPFSEFYTFLVEKEGHPPTTALIVKVFLHFSRAEWCLRLPFLLAGLAACWGIYLIGTFYINRPFGLVCMLLLAFSPQAVWASEYIRSYGLALCACTFSIYFFMRLLDAPHQKRWWIGYVLCALGSLYFFYIAALVIIAQNVAILIYWRRFRPLIKRWIVAQAGIILGFVPLFPVFYLQITRVSDHPSIMSHQGFYVAGIHVGSMIRTLGGLFGLDARILGGGVANQWPVWFLGSLALAVCVLSIPFFFYGVRFAFRHMPKHTVPACFFILLFGVPFLLANIAHNTIHIGLQPHYMLPISVAFICFFTGALFMMRSKLMRILIISGYIVIGCMRVSVLAQPFERWREVAAFLRQDAVREDPVFIFGDRGRDELAFYFDDTFTQRTVLLPSLRDQRSQEIFFDQAQDALTRYQQVWVLLSERMIARKDNEVIENYMMKCQFTLQSSQQFGQIQLLLFKKAGVKRHYAGCKLF